MLGGIEGQVVGIPCKVLTSHYPLGLSYLQPLQVDLSVDAVAKRLL